MVKYGLKNVYNDFGMEMCDQLCIVCDDIKRADKVIYALKIFNHRINAQKNVDTFIAITNDLLVDIVSEHTPP